MGRCGNLDRLQYVIDRLPSFWDKHEQDSRIRAVVKSFTDELALYDVQMDNANDMVGIITTNGLDLDDKWGKILDIPRMPGEDDSIYRNRMMTSVNNLSGGTKSAIRYSIGVAMNISTNEADMIRRINVVDAWLYNGAEPVDKDRGCVVCVVDLDGGIFEYKASIETVVMEAIKDTKASGVKVQLIFKNYRIMTYEQMATSSYMQLYTFRYNQLGDTL